jgi:hypothetical protein
MNSAGFIRVHAYSFLSLCLFYLAGFEKYFSSPTLAYIHPFPGIPASDLVMLIDISPSLQRRMNFMHLVNEKSIKENNIADN